MIKLNRIDLPRIEPANIPVQLCEICGGATVKYLVLSFRNKMFLCTECNEDMNAEIDYDLISNVQILIPRENI